MTDYSFFEKPILNSPYEYPAQHWELDASGQPTNRIIQERRLVELITPIPKPKKRKGKQRQDELVFDEGKGLSTAEQRYDPTPIINDLRTYVDEWRDLPENEWERTGYRGEGIVPGVEIEHCRRAESGLYRPRLDAEVPEHCGLLIAGDPRDRDLSAKEGCVSVATDRARWDDFREDSHWNTEGVQYRRVPPPAEVIIESGAGCIRRVGYMMSAACELPDEP